MKRILNLILRALLLLVNSSSGASGEQVSEEAYLAEISEELKKKWPKNRTIRVVCHGHSVPAGYFKTPVVDTFNAYPHLFHVGLKKQFPHAVINVIMTSIGGGNSEQGAKAGWTSMIEAAEAKGSKVVLLTPTGDLGAKLEDPADSLNQHAGQVRALAKTDGVGVADSLAAFQKYAMTGMLADLMSQGNHPNRKGHDLVVGELIKWFPR